MQYRKFGQLDWNASALGFGAMRLPTEGEESGDIDEERAIEMIRYAIDHGVNYVDTAWPYHDGNSEELVARALKDGYREKTRIATKLPSWLIEEPGDMDEYLDKQLDRLEVDQIDFYLLHTLNKKYWENYKEVGVFEWLDKVKEEGKIAYPGFSFHDDLETFKEIVDSYDWTFCQIQYNYLDREFQAGMEGLKYANSKGLAVVIMEPLRGGKLAAEPPEEIDEILSKADTQRGPVSWALNWLWDQPEVSLVLSGMTAMDQVKQNVELASNSKIGKLTEGEVRLMEEAAEKYREISPVGCTGCNYCTPCPNGVEIPTNFTLYNEAEVYGKFEENKNSYYEFLDEEQRASACVACGECEEACPQNLEIIDLLAETASYFNDS
ncbi:MAG: aldo/keto reductase [Candidatus Bipolaricaulota bacterium]|nr:aldo/keto reductase [Candidatus Bipolaricaulota bacterium]